MYLRDELLSEKEETKKRIEDLEKREKELQQLIQQVSEDFQKVRVLQFSFTWEITYGPLTTDQEILENFKM